MSTPSFNLVDEPWIPCLMSNGKTEKHSLSETLKRAHEIVELSATPIVTAALTRLLIAVVHRVLDGPKNEQAWGDVWRKGKFEPASVDAYLDKWKMRFDLFDEKRPFFQARLDNVVPKSPSIIDLTAASGNNPTLFDHSMDRAVAPIPPDEAARLLVAFQSFTPGSLVAHEGRGVISGKAGLLSKFWVFFVSGCSLFHTLMLNTPLYDPAWELPFAFGDGDDAPVWEREPPTSAAQRSPVGWLDTLTYPARRVQLMPNENAYVKQVKMTDGDRPASGWEQSKRELSLAFYMKNDNATDEDRPASSRGENRLITLAPQKERDLWRDATVLFCKTDDYKRPRMLEYVARRVSLGYVGENEQLGLEAYALATNQSLCLYWRHERLSLRTRLFHTNDEEGIGEAISSAIKTVDEVAKKVQIAVTKLTGNFKKLWAERAMSKFWLQLAPGFDQFLVALPDKKTAFNGWAVCLEAAVDATWSMWSASFPSTTAKFYLAADAEKFRKSAKDAIRKLKEANV